MDSNGPGGSHALEQDSGILDVEDDEEDDEVRKLHPLTETRVSICQTFFIGSCDPKLLLQGDLAEINTHWKQRELFFSLI